MNRPRPRVTTQLLTRRALAFKRHLRAAVEGDGHGVHQARVASRRLREAVPVLATGLKGSKAGKHAARFGASPRRSAPSASSMSHSG